MEGESGVTRNIIDELHSLHIEADQMEGESGVSRSIIDELHSSDIQRDEMQGESCVTRNIIDEVHFPDMVKRKVKVVLLEVSLMNFILGTSKEIKWR